MNTRYFVKWKKDGNCYYARGQDPEGFEEVYDATQWAYNHLIDPYALDPIDWFISEERV
jgi:hypothetical protein